MKTPTILLSLLLIALLSGCATLLERDTAVRGPITYATLKLIDGNADRAAEVHAVGSKILAMLDDAEVTAATLDEIIRDEIDWTRLDPADQLLITELLHEFRHHLDQYIARGALDPNSRDRLKRIVNYVLFAAKLSL